MRDSIREDEAESTPVQKLSLHPTIANAESLQQMEGKIFSLQREIGDLKGTLNELPSQLTASILLALQGSGGASTPGDANARQEPTRISNPTSGSRAPESALPEI